MPGMDVNQLVKVSRTLPAATPDGPAAIGNPRGSRYLEQYVLSLVPTKHLLADEGQYFVTTNPTPGTPITYALQTAFSDTSALIVIKNNDNPGGKRIYLDFLKLLLGAAPATTSSIQYAVKLDNINRQPTAGSQTLTPANANMDSASAPIAQVFAFNAAAPTVPASSNSARVVARGTVEFGLNIAGDEYVIKFGQVEDPGATTLLTAARATGSGRFADASAPIIIGPQQFAVIYLWMPGAATTAPTFEFELAHWER